MSLSRAVKHGIGRLTASADTNVTRLTQVSHKAPTRLIPVGSSSVNKSGAAICALSNYGGGMLQGDSSELFVDVKPNARLGVITQGASRIYSQRIPNECQATLQATVDQDALLVYAPDPCSLFAASSFAQKQEFQIHPESSIVLIDWFSSGRYRNGEHWTFDKLSSRTSLKWLGSKGTPFLQDSVSMDLRIKDDGSDPLGVYDFHAFASLILYGKDAEIVQQQCESLQDALAGESTRIRERGGPETSTLLDLKQLKLAGQVCMGISRVKLEDNDFDAHVVRLAATTNEDIYRVFHHCLQPLGESFGLEFYKDRIRAKFSEIPRLHQEKESTNGSFVGSSTRPKKYPQRNILSDSSASLSSQNDSSAFWSAYMLADSCMPTGSFAHSSGLEAATQLGIVKDEDGLQTFIQAATRSTMQVMTPFLIAGHRLVLESVQDHESIGQKWEEIDQQMQAVLAPNAPSCAASLDQGKSLLRVAKQWLGENNPETLHVLKSFDQCRHVAPIMGAVGALLGLDELQVCRLFGYCTARDMVSAAVRLSLVGPLASVRLLYHVQGAAEDGCKVGRIAMEEYAEEGPLVAAAASAPIVEAIHPCHELLQVRLFRS